MRNKGTVPSVPDNSVGMKPKHSVWIVKGLLHPYTNASGIYPRIVLAIWHRWHKISAHTTIIKRYLACSVPDSPHSVPVHWHTLTRVVLSLNVKQGIVDLAGKSCAGAPAQCARCFGVIWHRKEA